MEDWDYEGRIIPAQAVGSPSDLKIGSEKGPGEDRYCRPLSQTGCQSLSVL
jgi:hypothetical protein